MPRKKTHEEFVREVEEKYGNEYTVLEDYINSNIKILIRHNKCGYEWKTTPSSLLRGHGCPRCFGTPKKTTDEFKEEIYNKYRGEYDILGEYINNHAKILVKHNKCGYKWEVIPKDLLRGHGCPKCYGNIKKTHEQFIKEIYNKYNNKYTILGKYINSNIKILVKCNECKYEWETRPSSLLLGKGCPNCTIKNRIEKNKKTHNQFIKEIKEKYGDKYIILSKYVDNNTKILVKHKFCGYEWITTPGSLLQNGKTCPKCHGTIKKDTRTFIKEIKKIYADEYSVIGEYVNNHTKILMRHNKCGYEWYVTPKHILHNHGCPKCAIEECANKRRKTREEFVKQIYNLYGNEYTVLGEYINSNTKILFRHNVCGYEWEVLPSTMLQGVSNCPKCRESKGENRVEQWLRENNINYKIQYTFETCKHIRPLPFDFYLPDYNACIEYDGEQHKKPVRFNGISEKEAIENFKETQKRDKIKNDYCKTRNIPLLRIPYTEFNNIENILENFLKEIKQNNNNRLTKSENVI